MSYDVVIKIFGKITDVDTIRDLANDAAAEGRVEWMFNLKPDTFMEMLISAARNGQEITLTRRDTTDFFEGVRSSCQNAGLSYVVSFGESGNEGYSEGISWSPDLDQEFEFLLDGKNPAIRVSDVQKASAQGIDAVNALVQEVIDRTQIGKIEIEPGLDLTDFISAPRP